jgi:stage V sporulation protein R
MLEFFTDYGRPVVYVIDDEFIDGGLLLYHRNKGRNLRDDWTPRALKNINHIWKAPVYLISGDQIMKCTGNKIKKNKMDAVSFEEIRERMRAGKKPIPQSLTR